MSIAGRIGMGWFGDKVERRYVAAGAFAMMGFGLLCFGLATNVGTWILLPFLAFFGIGYGGSGVLRAAMGSDLFGRKNYGTIFGFLIGMTWVGGMIGPPLAGWVFDHWGSYNNIWHIYASLSIFALICVLLVRPLRSVVQSLNNS
jgi:MFS family permease